MLPEVAHQDLDPKPVPFTVTQGCVLSFSSAFHPFPHREQESLSLNSSDLHNNPGREAVFILI